MPYREIRRWPVAAGATAGEAGGFVAQRRPNYHQVADCILHRRNHHKATGYAGGAMADGVCHCRCCAMRYFLKNRPSAALIGNKIITHIGAVARKRAISRIPHWPVAAGATAGVAGGFVGQGKRNQRGVDDCISHGRDRHKATGSAGGAMADGVCHCRSCAMRHF